MPDVGGPAEKLSIIYVWLHHPAGCYTDTTMTHLYCNLATRFVSI